jgi:hypothetical protein
MARCASPRRLAGYFGRIIPEVAGLSGRSDYPTLTCPG